MVRLHIFRVTKAQVRRQFVELSSESLGSTPRIAEDDGAAMLLHQLQDSRRNTRPDAGAPLNCRGGGWTAAQLVGDFAELPHVFHGNHHFDFQGLARAGVDDCHGTRSTIAKSTEES